jgi:PAS domain S-box-containing protein
MNPSTTDLYSVDIRNFFTSLPGSNVLVRPNAPVFTIVAVSDAYLQATGRTRDELIGRGLFDLFPNNPEDPNQTSEKTVRASLEYALLHKEPHHLPIQRYDIPLEDGTYTERYWAAANKPVVNEAGEVVYLIHTAEDITSNLQAEQKAARLRHIEKAYSLFMQAPIVIGIVKGDDYQIELANDGILQLWGRGPEVIGKSLMEAIPELEGQGFIELLDEVRRTGKPYYAYERPSTLVRNGKEETLYLDFVYQPYYEEGESVASGVFAVAHDVTRQVLARRKAYESEQRFKDLVSVATVATAVYLGREMRIQYANEAMIRVWGKDASVIGTTIREALPELEGQPFHDLLDHVFTTGETYWGKQDRVDLVVDGKLQTFYYNFSYKALRNVDGEVYGILNMATDVTEQVLSRKRIEEQNRELQFVMDVMPQLVWHTQPDGGLDFANNVYLDYTGVTLEKLTGFQWMNLVHPDDLEVSARTWHKALAAESDNYSIEHRLRGKNGQYRWFLSRGVARKDKDGKILRWYGTTTDIEEQKTAAEVLQQSKERFELVAKATQDAIWDWDLTTDLLWWNDGFKALFGYSDEDIEPGIESWYNRLHPDDKQRIVDGIHQVIDSGGKQWSDEYRFRKKDGSYAIVFDRGYALHDKDGKPVRMLGSIQDITERKQWEQGLERMVKERTTELEDLNQELKRTNANLEDFAYAASHDMKEPIRKIQFFADRLKHLLKGQLSEEQSRLFGRMEHAAHRMGNLIDDLLTYSRVSRGAPNHEVVDLNRKVQMVLEDLELEVQEKNATVSVGQLPTVMGHKRQLQQLFQNLIGNALKYSKPGTPPKVHITAHRVKGDDAALPLRGEERQREYHLIEVRDNGIGFDQHDAEKIFSIFTRLHGNTEYKGTGVGLSIAQKVVDNHGGKIWAESQPGEGATFRVLLPAE